MTVDYSKKMYNSRGDELSIFNKICLDTYGFEEFKTCSWDVYCDGIKKAFEIARKLSFVDDDLEEIIKARKALRKPIKLDYWKSKKIKKPRVVKFKEVRK